MTIFKRGAAGRTGGSLAPLVEMCRDFLVFSGRRTFGVAVFLTLGALLESVGLLLLLPLLSVVLGTGSGNAWLDGITGTLVAWAPGGSPMLRLSFLLGLFGALIAIRAFVILTRDLLLARLQIGFVEMHRLRIIRLLAHSRWDVVARLRHGRITHVLGEDVQSCGLAAHLVLQCSVAAALLAGQWVLVILLSPWLALLVFVLLAAAALALRPVLRRSAALGRGLTNTNLGLVTGTTQFLGGLKLALSQNLQKGFVDEFAQGSERASGQRIAFTRQRTVTQLTLTALASFIAGLVIFVGIGFLDAAPASLVAFLFILARMNGPAALLQASAQQVFHSLPAYGKIKALEAELEAAQQDVTPQALPVHQGPGRIELRDAVFRHEGEAGLRHANLVIAPGSFVGITGPSGAGKTTFADLLVGLYPPQAGAVLVDGVPLTGNTLATWRASISYVSQDPFLFHDSIRRNLDWARPGASEGEMWEALALAGADGLVRRLNGGLEASAGERGTLLSGGERQRIALARALIRRPRLLLLDEATNAIDVDGEREILERLRTLGGLTLVMIAHRESSLALCDHVVELRDGHIVATVAQEPSPHAKQA